MFIEWHIHKVWLVVSLNFLPILWTKVLCWQATRSYWYSEDIWTSLISVDVLHLLIWFSCSPPYSHSSFLLLHLSLPPSSSFPPLDAKKIQLARVTFSYAAENPDELDLQPGQVRTLPPLNLNPHSFHPHSCILTHSPSLISPSLTHLTHHTLTHHTSHSHSPLHHPPHNSYYTLALYTLTRYILIHPHSLHPAVMTPSLFMPTLITSSLLAPCKFASCIECFLLVP